MKFKVGQVIKFEPGDLPSVGPHSQKGEPSYLVITKIETFKDKGSKHYGPWIGSSEINDSDNDFGPIGNNGTLH